MTGVSGSGKSSLAFDTLYAEGQRRYVESLSSYARQFLGQMPKPEVDSITGLAPSISIQQKTSSRNPRSTVGTITEIYDYLRVLFARVGQQNCSKCGKPISAQTSEHITDSISRLPEGTKFQVLAPLIQGQKGEYRDLFDDLLKQGFVRARVDGEIVSLADDLKLDKQMRHFIEVVIDRLIAGKVTRNRLAEAVEQALKLSGGTLIVSTESTDRRQEVDASSDENATPTESNDQLFSSDYACTDCGLSFEAPSPQLFSFNSPQGMCLDCNGLGDRFEFVMDDLIAEPKKSLWNGALALLGAVKGIGRWRRHIYKGVATAIETDLEQSADSFLKTPWNDLSDESKKLFLYGLGDRHITFSWGYHGGTWKHGGTYDGFIPELLDSYRKARNPMRRKQLEKYMKFVKCSSCHGDRLNSQAMAVSVTSTSESYLGTGKDDSLSLPNVCSLDIQTASAFFQSLELDDTRQFIAEEALKEIRGRLGFLLRCGLNYLTLDRTAPTLSGGETQRIRLAGQIGCGLVDVVYILDEPSIGLHPRDNRMLLESLCDLRDQGNTVIVVEHDEETMQAADQIIDFGPGPGVRGGQIVANGSVDDIKNSKASVTGQYLSGARKIGVPTDRRQFDKKKQITIKGATHHNLKSIDVDIPLGMFVCVTGVSGSGKSSLINDILWQVLKRDINRGDGLPGDFKSLKGLEHIDKAIAIDQSPIGRTPRSNPATYVKLLDLIRQLFTKLPESKLRGYKPGRFSFNVPAGRCEACEGHGANKLEMDFLADIWVTCPICNAKRFNHETLEVRFKGKNIAEILDMDVQEALGLFENQPKIHRLLQTLHDVGLDYLKLGQPSPTLSGGEAQRIKLARELGKRSTGQTVYLLDEPTTGLHFVDIEKLLEVLQGFVTAGNTVLVVEHNLDVIKTADWVIDLGPDGGSGGGEIIATGTPEDIAKCGESFTGAALSNVLGIKRPKKAAARLDTPVVHELASTTPNEKGRRNRKKAVEKRAALAPLLRADASGSTKTKAVTIRGASQHNLQNVDIEIPRDTMNVFCGPSGSGKSSLAMDTLYAEGQRRYVESLSAYARQFLGQMPKPKVDHIHGLQPSIAIEQKSIGGTPRSTVGTVTEIYDYLRILWCRLGTQHCPECQTPVQTQTTDEVIERLFQAEDGTKLLLLAPQDVRVGQSYDRLWENLKEQGFARVRVNSETHRIESVPDIDRKRRHEVEVVVDRVTIRKGQRARVAESVESAFGLGQGVIRVATVDSEREETDWEVHSYSLFRACEACGRSFEELAPNNFSFNSPLGWCDECEGLGNESGTDLSVLINDPQATLEEAAISIWPDPRTSKLFASMLKAIAKTTGIKLDVPFSLLDPVKRRTILHGAGDRWFNVAATKTQPGFSFQYKGLFPTLEEASRVSYKHRRDLAELVGDVPCSACDGSRLRDDSANMRFHDLTLHQVCEMPLERAVEFLQTIRLTGDQKRIAGDLLEEAQSRLSFLVEVGLEYLTLTRPLPTLSGGESQRIRLAGQIGRALTGVCYVLDEPTIGLHPRDNKRLLGALTKLRDLGNTLVLVEHDREVIEQADQVFDFGPGAGRFGGTITKSGTAAEISRSKDSLTGQYLGGKLQIVIPENRRMDRIQFPATSNQGKKSGKTNQAATTAVELKNLPKPPGPGWLSVKGARQNNLRSVSVNVPLGAFCVVTGVSGSGKSSLIEDTLARILTKNIHRAQEKPGPYDKLVGLSHVNKAIVVDQRPLGSTPKSNPGTYTGVFDHIRDLYARMPDAKVRGYRPGRFSFNKAGGRCEACEGDGQKKIEMHFLPDVWVECDDCRGQRYNQETLAVKYKGHSIADVLKMSIGECLELFENVPKIRKPFATLCAIGLDYLTLGQSATTLSGGEAQRVKLAAELTRPSTGRTVYILDEPTTGLHFDDIEKLLKVLGSLVELGNTVVVIEHNLDVIKVADWVIDVGPEAGSSGGWIVAQGTPEDIVDHSIAWNKQTAKKKNDPDNEFRRSHTGEQLAAILNDGSRGSREFFDVKKAGKKRNEDVSLSELGKDAKMPWEADGRRWHVQDRIAHSGNKCRWEGRALEWVVEYLDELAEQNSLATSKTSANPKRKKTAKRKGFAGVVKGSDLLKSNTDSESKTQQEPSLLKVNWNDPSTVEVTGENKRLGWFAHALTRDEWLLKWKFRAPKGTFEEASLSKSLGMREIDDIDEIPVYGRGRRVQVKNISGPWQEISITVHKLEDIETEAFRSFLAESRLAYFQAVEQASTDPKDVTPWKVLGKKWHLTAKGFPANKKASWKIEAIEALFNVLDSVLPDADVIWTERQFVRYRKSGSKKDWISIVTKRRAGIDIMISPGKTAPGIGRVAEIASEHEVLQDKHGAPQIRLRFHKKTQIQSPKVTEFLRKCLTSD
jgi:excinuclease ABC subunit A